MPKGKHTPDLRPLYAQSSPYRVRLPGSVAQALEWPTEAAEFACYGVFRARGEMLCATQDAVQPDGTHPFKSALDYKERVEAKPSAVALRDIPSAAVLALDFLIFEFTAKWTNANRVQLDLNLTTTHTSLLGWRRGGQSPPIYPKVWSGMLLLFSQERLFAMQDEEGAALIEE